MSALVYRAALVAVVGFLAMSAQANAGGMVPPASATVVPSGYDTDFHPWCAVGSHYACRIEPYGTRFCGCWLGGDHPGCPIGYFFACGRVPNGPPACGCY